MTKQEFEKEYCNKSEITLEDYHEYFVTLTCNCDDEGCHGWSSVCNDLLSIKNHKRLYC